ncbi:MULTISPECIES: 2OG-Fe(II) oxygenase [Paraburkholderia]|uniref:2OG-Fe(II) oxygenase n=1 Tax=Paraburkholderia TaxID=1822464 RepID=UPI002253AB11|nr:MULTISPECIES: 2OG-Fe(II) oxygenase [Paraburkholderia]MCX4162376.1 2OG-Fe(II) oxygenase [Paraburkholderia megapolitana]MDN7157871.1 2OG-Fe(II) oxygenase [Paraburkholderia sp. CHISQ3]MDQ6494918.1 2OG-Fe(II) oxygenase [Paraburkholderia megapolitana]
MPSHFMLQDTLPGVEPRDLIESKSSEVSTAHSDDATLDRPSIASTASISHRVDTADWPRIARELDQYGCAMLPGLLDARECNALAALYPRDDLYRSRVVMARHGFGRGEYRYFDYPLPDVVGGLRTALYPHLVPVANRWNETMGIEVRYPTTHAAFLRRCHDAGQLRPTPLILQYGKDDYNCLHQDLYGEHVFPLQAAILLSEPDVDFSGGEFVMTEQRPRMQSRVEVVPLRQGDAAIFAVHHRPVRSTRAPYRVNLRHGVSRLRSGRRHTLGVIFHDAL